MPTSSSSTTPSSVTSTTTSQCLVDIRFYLHVFWQGKNVIHALPEAEINSFIIPYKEEAAAFPLWMVTDLESKDPFANIFLQLQMAFFGQFLATLCAHTASTKCGKQSSSKTQSSNISLRRNVMDKSWMYQSRLTNEWVMRSKAVDHLVCDGFIKGYTKWIAHGEALSSTTTAPIPTNSGNALGTNNSMREMLHDTFGISNRDDGMDDMPNNVELSNADAKKFYKLLSDAQKPLYPGCKEFSKLSLLVELFHNKCLGKWTNDSFTKLLRTFNRALPEGEKLPNSYYERYKTVDNHEGAEGTSAKKCKKVPRKVLRHFPLIPRLQRLFMSSKIASFMKWHDEGRTKDGCMRHPADSPAWQTFDFQHKEFATDSRNVRLGLASNGFNPFGMMSNVHSTWPVILMPYNLPPWMCMKQPYFIMSLLIPGRSAPENNIDVYLQPLIEELKELWGVEVDTFDASTNQNFKMHAALMWTINDFPAYANLSGWSTKGRLACPSCHKDTCSSWLKYSGKHIYMDHRRFLEDSHMIRQDKRSFNGKEERRKGPCRLTGSMIQDQLKGVQFKFGKLVKDNPKLPFNWKKPSIFFELPYWKDNLLRHNLDVMHIEKNVCDRSLEGTSRFKRYGL
ncbi:uncharacterized protein LOC131323837 [Rhododendron vialii]|uniref:uncharacterized protein LOC131323837 n=1 Tax=Rhododendron vialii TaxID=182163 RepID=UPI00265F749A|nr:uncharacterized protein LOC131323837 [Rhododendron vialii]